LQPHVHLRVLPPSPTRRSSDLYIFPPQTKNPPRRVLFWPSMTSCQPTSCRRSSLKWPVILDPERVLRCSCCVYCPSQPCHNRANHSSRCKPFAIERRGC